MKIGTRVKSTVTGRVGTIVNHPTEFDERYVSVLWDGDNSWPAGYVTRIESLQVC
jgi:hypothetical protein